MIVNIFRTTSWLLNAQYLSKGFEFVRLMRIVRFSYKRVVSSHRLASAPLLYLCMVMAAQRILEYLIRASQPLT